MRQLGLGLVMGVVFAAGATWLFGRLPETIGAFAPVTSVAAAAIAFGATDFLGGSGFVAVYLVGLAVGSTPSCYRHQIVTFHEGLAFLAQVALFIVFGLLVFPHELGAVAGSALALTALLIVVIRPLAVWLSTALCRFTTRERLLLGWAGLRGAAPIVLATFVLSAKIDNADLIFNAVFFVVVASTLLQGTTLEPLARRLRLVDPRPISKSSPLAVDAAARSNWHSSTWPVITPLPARAVSELGLPRHALVAVVTRGAQTIPPRGSTRIHPAFGSSCSFRGHNSQNSRMCSLAGVSEPDRLVPRIIRPTSWYLICHSGRCRR